MAILSNDPMRAIKVGDMFDITWKAHDKGPAKAHSFYRQDLQTVITKLLNLHRIDSNSIALFITPQFERPNFLTVITQCVEDGKAKSIWDIEIYETEEGFNRRARIQNFLIRVGDGPSTNMPLYHISIRPKYGHPIN